MAMIAVDRRIVKLAGALVVMVLGGLLLTGCHRDYDLGDFVWLDVDEDGIQDTGEPGVAGVTVRACSYSDASDYTCFSTATDSDGHYRAGLPVHPVFPTYVEVFFEPPPGYRFTLSNRGDDDTVDSDGGFVTLGPFNHRDIPDDNNTVDLGLLRSDVTVGDFVWEDVDGDGIQDPGEPGLPDIPVTLLRDTDAVASTMSGTDGTYTLGPVPAGEYRVRFGPLPAGYQFTAQQQGDNFLVDSDPSAATGETDARVFVDGAYVSIDAGAVRAGPVPAFGSIGDFVWDDIETQGLQEPDEPGLANVTVTLLESDGTVVAVTTTDQGGRYEFVNLAGGTYTLRFEPPPNLGYEPTFANVGSDDTIDSDINRLSGEVTVTLLEGQTDLTVDAGFSRPS